MSTFTVRIRAVMVIYSQIAKENSYIKRVDFYLAFSLLKQRDFVRTKFKITDVTQSVFSSWANFCTNKCTRTKLYTKKYTILCTKTFYSTNSDLKKDWFPTYHKA